MEATKLDNKETILYAWKNNLKNSEKNDRIHSDVLLFKILPDHHSYCKIHDIPMREKNVMINHSYGINGYYCPECIDFYVENYKSEALTKNLQERKIFYAIKHDDNWNFTDDIIKPMNGNTIFVSARWKDDQRYCPLHEKTKLSYDTYKKSVDGKTILFEACFCSSCNKIIIGKSRAEKLEKDCNQKKITKIHFKSLKKEESKKILPHYLLLNGKINKYDSSKIQKNWEILDEEDTLVVSENGQCKHPNHMIRTKQVIFKVRERSTQLRNYLAQLCYCEDCGDYYISLEDYSALFTVGRPLMKIVELAHKNGNITSGEGFNNENKHLNDLENIFETKISNIKSIPYYVDEYETIRGAANDDEVSRLIGAKDRCKPLYKDIKKIQAYQDTPYTNRVDIIQDGNTKVYYLGINDINLDGKHQVISTRSDYGRTLVNYRNKKLVKITNYVM